MNTELLLFINGSLIAICIILLVALTSAWKVRLNAGFVKDDYVKGKEVEAPKFKIDKIEYTYACNSFDKVAKYTAECWYKKKKDVDYQKVIFYDAIGKYNVGDELELSKIENNHG